MRNFNATYIYGQAEIFYEDIDLKEIINYTDLCKVEKCLVKYNDHWVYLKYGRFHRDDGPAVIHYTYNFKDEKYEFDGVDFFLENEYFEQEEWLQKISKENRIKYLFNLDEVSK